MPGRRVLITGVASFFGAQLARRLEADPDVEHVVGIDMRRPRVALERTELIEVDLRDTALARIVPAARVDTVVHNGIVRQPGPRLSPQQAHDINVIGSLGLLAACERSDAIEAIVIRGSAGIYGSEPAAPQFFTEEMSRLYPPRTRFQRDVAEIENYFEGYSRRNRDVVCTMLRYQPAIGPSVDTQVTRYLSLPAAPTYLGFDPRQQWIHEQDGVEALVAAVRRPVRGAVNVAAPGTIGLTRMLRIVGRPSIPVAAPLFGAAANATRRLAGVSLSPDFRRLLQHGRAVDVSRLEREVGFRPRFDAVEAVEDYARTHARRGTLGPLARVAPAR
jgi:UDP-glucose 4-epimerase